MVFSANLVLLLKSIFRIDKGMIPCKVAYFLTGCHMGSYQAFLTIFFVSVGMSKEQSGMLSGMMFVLPIIACPIWGLIVDFTGKRKLVLFLIVYSGSPLFSALPWIAHSLNPIDRSDLQLVYTNSSEHNQEKSNMQYMNLTNSSHAFKDIESIRNGFGTGYWTILAIILFTSIFNMPLPIFVDTIGMNAVKNNKNGAVYSTQRCFWIMGGLTGALLSGVASNYFKHPYLSPYTGVFIIYFASSIFIFPIGCILIDQGGYQVIKDGTMIGQNEVKDDITNDNQSHLMVDEKIENTENLSLKGIIAFHLRVEILVFLTTAFLTGCGQFLFLNTAYLHMDETMNVTKIEMTYVINVGTASNFVFSMLSSNIISFLGGSIRAIVLGMFMSSIRYFIISFDISYPLLLCVQISTGLSLAIPWNACMEHCNTISPKKMYATTNAVMLTTFRFLSNVVTSALGLKIYAMVGIWKLFFIFSTVCFAWFIFIFMYYEAKNINRYCNLKRRMDRNNGIEEVNVVKG